MCFSFRINKLIIIIINNVIGKISLCKSNNCNIGKNNLEESTIKREKFIKKKTLHKITYNYNISKKF